jgi:hypothetical protein
MDRMTNRQELYEHLWAGPMFQKWHWLAWNFRPGADVPFARLTLDALVRCDAVMPGYAEAMLTTLESIGGRNRDLDDYEAIRQWLGELLVVHHFVTWTWPEPVTFKDEPTTSGSAVNPEILIAAASWRLGLEVKTPDLRSLAAGGRNANPWQMLARTPGGPAAVPGQVTLPRDNPVKDFLVSADKKFAGFRATDPAFRSVLAIVWDDYINEPLSALASPASGLFTDRSFHRNADDTPHSYPNVDSVVLIRHQHQFVEGMANRPPLDERWHFLDYGDVDRFPPHAIVPNPHGQPLNETMADALQGYLPDPRMGAEYLPAELVIWT